MTDLLNSPALYVANLYSGASQKGQASSPNAAVTMIQGFAMSHRGGNGAIHLTHAPGKGSLEERDDGIYHRFRFQVKRDAPSRWGDPIKTVGIGTASVWVRVPDLEALGAMAMEDE